MNVLARALTQNLRDIRANWAGSGPWLRRVGSSLALFVGLGLLRETAKSASDVIDAASMAFGVLVVWWIGSTPNPRNHA